MGSELLKTNQTGGISSTPTLKTNQKHLKYCMQYCIVSVT